MHNAYNLPDCQGGVHKYVSGRRGAGGVGGSKRLTITDKGGRGGKENDDNG